MRLRVRRASMELAAALARIATLEAENAAQAKRIKELEAENRGLRAENSRLTGCKRRLEAANEGLAQRVLELKTTSAQELEAAREQLKKEALKRRAAERVSSSMERELVRLRALLLAAERHFEKATVALAREREAHKAVRVKSAREAAVQRVRAAEREQELAAQVAAAQYAAAGNLEAALAGRVEDAGLMTLDDFARLAAEEAAAGDGFSPTFRKVAAHVMEGECVGNTSTSLLPTNASGKGRGFTYMRIVASIKASDRLGHTQLWERTKALTKTLEVVSAGAPVAQMANFLNHNKALILKALHNTWLQPPKIIELNDLLSLRAEMSGAMYDAVTRFIRRKTGAPPTHTHTPPPPPLPT